MRYLTLVMPAGLVLILALTGCTHSVDAKQFDAAIGRIDHAIRAVDSAIEKITQDSKAWRETLAKLERDLKADAQDVMANEVKNVAEAIGNEVGKQPLVWADYLEVKLKDNLKAFRAALEEAKTEVQAAKAKNDKAGIGRALDKLVAVQVFHDPVVTACIPGHVQIDWADHAQTAYAVRPPLKDTPLIEVRGWGFERPPGETVPRFTLEVVDAAGKKRRDLPASAVFLTDRYKLQIKLDTPGVTFEKGDHGLVLALGPRPADRRTLPITHVVPPAPVVKPAVPTPTVDRVVFTLRTQNENKEVNGRVRLYLLGADGRVLLERGPLGEEEDWGPQDVRSYKLPFNGLLELLNGGSKEHSHARIPAPPGTTFTARIQLENFRTNGVLPFGLNVKDAVKWDCTWDVELQQWTGQAYQRLCQYTGTKSFKADGTDQGDVTVTIPPPGR